VTSVTSMTEHQIALRRWQESDAPWYADANQGQAIQQCTTDPPDPTAADDATAIHDRNARGHGVATRARQVLLATLREQGRVSVVRLWTHADNIALRRAAELGGFVRDPAEGCDRTIKAASWPTVAGQALHR
jgi:hypothetical protein